MREIIIIITAVCSHQLYGIDSISSLTLRSFIKNIKEHKERSVLFIKNTKERENVAFFWKERIPNPAWQWCRSSTLHPGCWAPCFYDYNPSGPLMNKVWICWDFCVCWVRLWLPSIFHKFFSPIKRKSFTKFLTLFFLLLVIQGLKHFYVRFNAFTIFLVNFIIIK